MMIVKFELRDQYIGQASPMRFPVLSDFGIQFYNSSFCWYCRIYCPSFNCEIDLELVKSVNRFEVIQYQRVTGP